MNYLIYWKAYKIIIQDSEAANCETIEDEKILT